MDAVAQQLGLDIYDYEPYQVIGAIAALQDEARGLTASDYLSKRRVEQLLDKLGITEKRLAGYRELVYDLLVSQSAPKPLKTWLRGVSIKIEDSAIKSLSN